jgi:hypothetical protein
MVAPAMEHNLRRAAIATFLLGLLSSSASVRAEEALSLEGKIALPGVVGRIDHMAVDLARKRLLVAALGNGSLEIVDLAGTHRVKQVVGLHEPQGIAYAQKPDLVAVASAGDGTVRFYRGEDLAPAGSLALGSDADNVRIDPRTGNVIVGYGSGGLAIIDPEKRSKIGNIKLAAHPESFQIAVVDLAAAKQIARWTVPGLSANFPLALDGSGTTVAAVFRHPAKLVLLNPETGAATQQLDTCGDADDVFFDTKRRRIYVSCGAGAVDVFQDDAAGYHPVARVETSSGARTSLFVPELDRLYIAARAGLLGSDAAILVFRP